MFTIFSECSSDSTLVSNLFIDEYMKNANDAQIKVYLYLLRAMSAHRTTSVSELADHFNHTEKDVVRSLRYWEKKGLLDLSFDNQENLISICLRRPETAADRRVLSFAPPAGLLPHSPLSVSRTAEAEEVMGARLQAAAGADPRIAAIAQALPAETPQAAAAEGPQAAAIVLTAPAADPRTAATVLMTAEEPPQAAASAQAAPAAGPRTAATVLTAPVEAASSQSSASPAPAGKKEKDAGTPLPAPAADGLSEMEALESFRSSADRAQLLFVIEQYIGKPLSLNEIRIIYHISENLHFSDDLLDHLLQYCVDRGRKDFRYIRKVAENWAAQGIMTPAQAEEASLKGAAKGRAGAGRTAGGKKGSGSAKKNAGAPFAGRTGPGEETAGAGFQGKNRSGSSSGRPRSSNSFNQFEQNSYDFDALEEELLQS